MTLYVPFSSRFASFLFTMCPNLQPSSQTWPTCSVSDTARYYAALLAAILSPTPSPYNKEGFYFAISENVSWNVLSRALAARLHALGIIASAELQAPDYPAAAKALGVPEDMVDFQVDGRSVVSIYNA